MGLVVSLLAVSAFGLGLVGVLVASGDKAVEPEAAKTGSVLVTSVPPGGNILLDGRDTHRKTPAEVDGIPLNTPHRITVRSANYRTSPEHVTVTILDPTRRSDVQFKLTPIPMRAFRIETIPAGASVALNGNPLQSQTPLTLDPIPYGQTASVSVMLAGYFPTSFRIDSRADTATVTSVKLQPAREIDFDSEPPGAVVSIDGEVRGRTPVAFVQVPARGRIRLRIERAGYKPYNERVDVERLPQGGLRVKLNPLPLSELQLNGAEKREEQGLRQRLRQAVDRQKTLRSGLPAKQKRLEKLVSSPDADVSDIAEAQQAVDAAQTELRELDRVQATSREALEGLHRRVLVRLGSDAS
jgi:hypothetical protein